ncbi:MAG: nitrogen regulation protein NR(II) [Gammaproteobacteria bacterium]|nr:nitrogen regulation protein NR(II) [Gammaproteobacteria bacterium]
MPNPLPASQALASLVNHLTTAIVLVNARMEIVALNLAAENLFRVSQHQMQLEPIGNLLSLDPLLKQQLEHSSSHQQSFTSRDTQIQQPNGHTLLVDLTVTAVDEQGSLALEIQPLERMKRLTQEARMMTQQHASSNLVRNLAHEIKNPLGGIRGAAQLLQRELTPSLHEFTEIIISEADRLRDLVDRLLGPQRQTQKQACNIHQILDKIDQLLRAEADSQVVLIRDYDPSLPELLIDANQMTQAFLNVGLNALQALLEHHIDGGQIRLKTRAVRRFTIGNTCHRLVCCISIIDNGPGIPTDLKEEIFFPLVTHRPQGTGLGLSISQSLVQQHQGLIECNSKKGHTCFNIYLPMENLP